jgi:hypothetical protein
MSHVRHFWPPHVPALFSLELSEVSDLIGAQGRDRTTDTVIFSHVLYQLSYLGAGLANCEPKGRAPGL